MASILLTGPAIEPISLEETKTFLRIEHNDEDQLIAALIAGARSHIEAQTQTALITQDWRVVLDAWPQRGRIIVRPGPLKALNATRVFDCNGDPHVIDPQAVAPDLGASTLAFVPWAMPAPGRIAAGIEIDVTVGFGDEADDVPETLRQAIRMVVAHWYENRGFASVNQNASSPATVAALIAPYRMFAI
jgi:uncharacterized phiE125 gp8 family phage protein